MDKKTKMQTSDLFNDQSYLNRYKNEVKGNAKSKFDLEKDKIEDIQTEFSDNSEKQFSEDLQLYEVPKSMLPVKKAVPKIKEKTPFKAIVKEFEKNFEKNSKEFEEDLKSNSYAVPKPEPVFKAKPVPAKAEDLGDLGDVKSKRELMNIASFLLKQNICPSTFKTQNELFIALQTVFSLGVKNPGEMLLALNNMYLINNKIELFGDLPLALVKRFGDLIKIEEFFVDDKHEKICLDNKNLNKLPMAAICIITNSLGNSREFYLTDNDIKISGGIRNPDGSWKMGFSSTWKKYPKVHWARRLRGWALKCLYPHILKGVGIHEYDNSIEKKVTKDKKNAYTVMEETYTDKKDDTSGNKTTAKI